MEKQVGKSDVFTKELLIRLQNKMKTLCIAEFNQVYGLDYWKDKFEKLISFLHDKLHSWYDKDDKYIDVVNDMYDDNILDDDDIEELNLNKEKDDFKR